MCHAIFEFPPVALTSTSHKVTPILVFDGAPLPSKAGTCADRTKRRKAAREEGHERLKQGDRDGAERAFQRGISVTGLHPPLGPLSSS